jgi:hypothetical protein
MTTSIVSQADTINLLEILAPQLVYKDKNRADGFTNRFERGRAIFQKGNLYRSNYKDSVRWSVPSGSDSRIRHTVYLDPIDGQHQCNCDDRRGQQFAACCHIVAAAFAESDHQQSAAAAAESQESLDELTELLWGAYA